MEKVIMKAVGDALNLYLQESGGRTMLMVDFGIDKKVGNFPFGKTLCNCIYAYPTYNIDAFLLSHFHLDHYSGFEKINPLRFHFDDVYLPRFPQMKYVKELKILLVIDLLLRGNNLFLEILNMLFDPSSNNVKYHLLSKDDIFIHNGHKYEVLWPPKLYNKDKDITADVKKAIDEFKKIKKDDKLFRDIYSKLNSYDLEIREDNGQLCMADIDSLKELIEKYCNEQKIRRILETDIYKNFNDALRNATNRLSIAFRQEDNVLFLGDLEKKELRCVSNNLKTQQQLYYDCLVAAHHGTHWHKAMKDLHCKVCLVSAGNSLVSKIKKEYKSISSSLYQTFFVNDIVLSK